MRRRRIGSVCAVIERQSGTLGARRALSTSELGTVKDLGCAQRHRSPLVRSFSPAADSEVEVSPSRCLTRSFKTEMTAVSFRSASAVFFAIASTLLVSFS